MSPNLRRGRVWTSALYEVADDFVPGDPLGPLIRLFRPRWAGWPGALHTFADPFLCVRGDRLYLLAEAQAAGGKGRIVGWSTRDLARFETLGTLLEAPHHLSYPFLFDWNGETYMVPESAEAGEVGLYRFSDFPFGAEKLRVLLHGAWLDTTLCEQGGIVYLFATDAAGLHLFTLRDMLRDMPEPHPVGIITSDIARARCGGAPIRAGGQLFRLAQNGSRGYGERLSAWRIKRLEADEYREELHEGDILGPRRGWNAAGGHHMSFVRFRGRNLVAVDGQAEAPLLPWLAKLPAKALLRALRTGRR